MRRWREAGALLQFAEAELKQIRRMYEKAAVRRQVTPELLIAIKIFAEQVRSALDYLAHDIREACGPKPSEDERVFFPVVDSAEEFLRKVPRWFPDLQAAAPEVYAYLERLQPYHENQQWFRDFIDLVNSGKHRNLAPHEIREERALAGAPDRLGPVVIRVSATEQGTTYDSWVEFVFPGIGNALLLLMQALEAVWLIHGHLKQIVPSKASNV